jgi:hypothetical protein
MQREADYYSQSWSVGARLGYDMAVSDRLLVQPSVGLTHISARSQAHDESLDGVRVIRVGDVDRSGTLLPLDVTLGYDLLRNFDSVLRLNVGLGYAYDFGDAPTGDMQYEGLIGAPSVSITNRAPDQHRLNLSTGVVYTRERFDFTARYDYLQRGSQTSHQANTSFGLKF